MRLAKEQFTNFPGSYLDERFLVLRERKTYVTGARSGYRAQPVAPHLPGSFVPGPLVISPRLMMLKINNSPLELINVFQLSYIRNVMKKKWMWGR